MSIKTRYYYETHQSRIPLSHFILAKDDNEAMKKFREKFGEFLPGLSIVYVEEDGNGSFRTVWTEE